MISYQKIDCKVHSHIFLTLALFLLFLIFPTNSLTDQERQQIFTFYTNAMNNANQQVQNHWNIYPQDVFNQWFNADIFTRVSQPVRFLGLGASGLVFQAYYQFPGGNQVELAAVKFMPERDNNDQQKNYRKNKIHAEITGRYGADAFSPEISRGYDENPNLNQVRVHRWADPNDRPDHTYYLNEFYEMQWIQAQNQQLQARNVTVMITRGGTQDLDRRMFANNNNIANNTNIFLERYYLISLAVANLNDKRILHGDIKTGNIILESNERNPGEIIPALIDFDLSIDWSEIDFHNWNPTLRYSKRNEDETEYRMPSIEDFENPDNDDYFYSDDLREDTFALAHTYNELLRINNNYIDANDVRIRAIKILADDVTNPNEFKIYQVPPSSTWNEMMDEIINKNNPDPVAYANEHRDGVYGHSDENIPNDERILII